MKNSIKKLSLLFIIFFILTSCNNKKEIINNQNNNINKTLNDNNENIIVNYEMPENILYEDVYNKYKNDNTLIGIDVSKYQGYINWKKVKENGIEFAMIRLGYQYDLFSQEIGMDDYFIQNIQGALENDIEVGVYFYSFATNNEEAINQANYVIDNIKNYNITMPVAFDWENYNTIKNLNISISDIRNASYTFQDEIKKAGYIPMQYGNRNNMYSFWSPIKYEVWIAHYLPIGYETDYRGSYIMWQLCNNGIVNGINGNVDIDIYYKKAIT